MAHGLEAQAVVYAALMLADDEIEVTPEKIQTVLNEAGIKVQPFWISTISKYFAGKKVEDLVGGVAVAAAPAGAAPAAAPAAAAGGAAPAKKEEKKKEPEPEPEDDGDMGFSLFD